MDKLPYSLLLHILSRLDDSADVARCRVASKAFDTVFPGIRSVNLQCSSYWSNVSTSQKPLKRVFLDIISKLETVESVCIDVANHGVNLESDGLNIMDVDFAKEWLHAVSGSLKSLSLSGVSSYRGRGQSNVLPQVSACCHNLVTLKLKYAWLSVHKLNEMAMLTSLTLEHTELEDEHLNEFNKCFPNLQVLNLVSVRGLKNSKIHLLNLKTCLLSVCGNLRCSLTLITPNLITLRIEAVDHLRLGFKKFENLKTLWVGSMYVVFLLIKFPITKTVENLTLDSGNFAPTNAKLTLEEVFTYFPNVGSLCIKSGAWMEFEDCLNTYGCELLDGRKGLKTICAYLELVDPSLTFSLVSRVLDQCVGLSEVSLLIHDDVVDNVSKGFMIKCVARWPKLKWRWGIWSNNMEDSWIPDVHLIEHPESSKKRRL